MGHRDVEKDGRWLVLLDPEQGRLAVAGSEHGITHAREELLDGIEELGLVVDEEDPVRFLVRAQLAHRLSRDGR